MLKNIYQVHPDILSAEIAKEFKSYRAKQVLDWLYKKFIYDPLDMSNLPKELKDWLIKHYDSNLPEIDLKLVSSDGTVKYRLKLNDGALIEMVIIPEDNKRTLCVSSQVGCSRNCSFCATAKMKLKRNLEVYEILGQIILACRELTPDRLTNIVFMGMGEPMDNLDNLIQSLIQLQSETGLSFSPRRITVSTCGVIPGIRKLADLGIKTKLAVSLNSAINVKRTNLMPVNAAYPLPDLKQSLLYFRRKTNFRITFEYILIPDVNMDAADLKALAAYVNDISCKVNIIPYNPSPGSPWRAPSQEEIEQFMSKAMIIKQAVTLRKSRGKDISGACGQLVAKV